MDENLLQFVLLLAYGPFLVMLLAFAAGLAFKWAGEPHLLQWLIHKTDAQQPLPRKTANSPQHGKE